MENNLRKILVVDDDPTLIKLLKTQLETWSYSVVTAMDGEEGLKKFQSEKPDLTILDIAMPKMDGYTFVLEYKKIADLKKNPIIMLTANESLREIFNVEGINDYIIKPFDMASLLKKIAKHLQAPDKNILVVDDSAEFVDLVENILNERGYRVAKALNGFDGLGIAKRINPDLIVLDVMMPKLDGYHVCRIIKYDQVYQNIDIIMLSARTEERDRLLGREVGADVYLDKPFSSDILLQKIKELLWD